LAGHFWGLRLYVLAAADGRPVTWCLASPKRGERQVLAELLEAERDWLRPGLLVVGDKGFAGRQLEQLIAGYGARLLRPDRTDEPRRFGSLGRIRQWIESLFDTLKDQLSRERHGGRTPTGGARAHRPAPARPDRVHLVELDDQRTGQAFLDRLRPLKSEAII
jgi:DDE family transposase